MKRIGCTLLGIVVLLAEGVSEAAKEAEKVGSKMVTDFKAYRKAQAEKS